MMYREIFLRKDKKHYFRLSIFIARVAELVDASVSKTDNRKVVPVRFRSWVLLCSLSLKFECVLFKLHTPNFKLKLKLFIWIESMMLQYFLETQT